MVILDAQWYESIMKRIFYFNITYKCNSACIYCYSHNTNVNAERKDITLKNFIRFCKKYNIGKQDRVILNGGEPFLCEDIEHILNLLYTIGCEILVYTNGRLLSRANDYLHGHNIRIIIPIHGYEGLHDKITGRKGNFRETFDGITKLQNSGFDGKIDYKIILNQMMCENELSWERCKELFVMLNNYNATHITKMDRTIVSERNSVPILDRVGLAEYTKQIFQLFALKGNEIKIFDTCVKKISQLIDMKGVVKNKLTDYCVYAGDYCHDEILSLDKSVSSYKACLHCNLRKVCMSAVKSYRVLKYKNGMFSIDWE